MTNPESLDIPVRPETKALAAQAGEIYWRHLWGALSKPLRAAMVEYFLSAVPADRSRRRRWFAAGITAEGAGFTPASLLGRSDAEMAREASRIKKFRDDLVSAVVVAYFTSGFLAPQRTLFAGAGIPVNDDGQPDRGWGSASPEAATRGINAVLADDRDRSWIYLIAVSIGWSAAWPGLVEALRHRAAASPAVPAMEGVEHPSEFPVEMPIEEPDTVPTLAATSHAPPMRIRRLRPRPEPSLTILDDLLTKTILVAEAGQAQALSRSQLTDLLDEFVRMDTERRRSAYHLGFADGLFGEPWREELRQPSEERRAWYAAGYLTARRRKTDPVTILEHWDHPSVRLLVGRSWAPLGNVLGIVLEMLVEGSRDQELARHAGELLDTNPRATLEATLTIGSRLLDERQPDRAYSVLAPAADWVALREVAPTGAPRDDERRAYDLEIQRLGYQVRRRFAHSCRLSGRRQDAEQELRTLCQLEAIEPETRAMLLADLGLLEAGYQQLADLTIPDQRSGFPDAVAQLGRGRSYFVQAEEMSPSGAAHAKYALGILAALEGDWSLAQRQLHTALSAFESRPSVYEVHGLLARARGYEAIATILTLENAESSRAAARRLQHALEEGLVLPKALTSDVALALVTADAAIGAPFLARLFETQALPPEEIVSLLVESPPEVRRILVEISAELTDRDTLPLSTRTRLAYKALESDDGSLPEGVRGDLLALIEDAACDGVDIEAFVSFIAQHRPGWGRWSRSDAAIAGALVCLANGRLAEAQDYARQAFNRLLTHQDRTAEHDPEGALDLLRMSGADPSEIATLTQRLGAASPAVLAPPVLSSTATIHILIVGGNETQAQYEAAINAEVTERYAGVVTVQMHTTGMVSNWNKHLDAVHRLLGDTDGVVISRYVRTMFGRNLRANLGSIPWRTCTTTGKAGFLRLIDDLAREIDTIRRARVHGASS